jgi:hypothetical protein
MPGVINRSGGETRRESPKAGGTILIATHGPGRGRPANFLNFLLERIRESRPDFSDSIKVWRTGTPHPPLDGVRAIYFMLADPIAHHPQCKAEAFMLARAARARRIRLLNRPGALDNTVKHRQSELWLEAGLPCARGVAASRQAELLPLLEHAPYPVMLRVDDRHVQEGMVVCRNKAEALSALPELCYPVGVLEYIDSRESWRRDRPASVFADYFHKRRAMVFGSRVVNNHIFFSDSPVVGGKTCTFLAARSGSAPPRLDEMVEADIAFAAARAEAPELMRAAVRALGLDIAAIDYSTHAAGSIVLWEANPFFHLPRWQGALLSEPRRLEERVPRMMDMLIDELEMVAEGAVSDA